jgi:hypothetical protein
VRAAALSAALAGVLSTGTAAAVTIQALFTEGKDAMKKARATLAPDDKDYDRLGGWLEDLQHVAGGKVIGRTGDPGSQPGGMQG